MSSKHHTESSPTPHIHFDLEVCGGLKEKDPQRRTGNDTIRRCGLVGVGVALLEEVCH